MFSKKKDTNFKKADTNHELNIKILNWLAVLHFQFINSKT